jgi:hypothetical protein
MSRVAAIASVGAKQRAVQCNRGHSEGDEEREHPPHGCQYTRGASTEWRGYTEPMRWTTLALAIAMLGADNPRSLKADLVFLTRDECVNAPDMLFNVEDAMKALGWPQDCQFVNIGKLPAPDVRTA